MPVTRWAVLASLLVALLGGCADRLPSSPRPESVSPPSTRIGTAVAVTIEGQSFFADVKVSFRDDKRSRVDQSFTARLGDTPLEDVVLVDSLTLTASVPATLELGQHDLLIEDPAGRVGSLEAAFEVLPPAGDPDGGDTDADSDTDSDSDTDTDTDSDSDTDTDTDSDTDSDSDTGADSDSDSDTSSGSGSDTSTSPPGDAGPDTETFSCDGGTPNCNQECAQGDCTMVCDGAGDCKLDCSTSSGCHLSCDGEGDCTLLCLSDCTATSNGTGDLRVNCAEGGCTVSCPSGCEMTCPGGGCEIADCPVPVIDCGPNSQACDRPCT